MPYNVKDDDKVGISVHTVSYGRMSSGNCIRKEGEKKGGKSFNIRGGQFVISYSDKLRDSIRVRGQWKKGSHSSKIVALKGPCVEQAVQERP